MLMGLPAEKKPARGRGRGRIAGRGEGRGRGEGGQARGESSFSPPPDSDEITQPALICIHLVRHIIVKIECSSQKDGLGARANAIRLAFCLLA